MSPPTYAYPGQPPAAQTWAQQAPGAAAGPQKTNGLAIAALVCGIAGCIVVPLGIVAIILGYMAKSQIRQTREAGEGMATTGIVLGIIQVVIGLIWLFLALFIFASVGRF